MEDKELNEVRSVWNCTELDPHESPLTSMRSDERNYDDVSHHDIRPRASSFCSFAVDSSISAQRTHRLCLKQLGTGGFMH
eukprot:9037417-Pyramimonas_sp.AAC.1